MSQFTFDEEKHVYTIGGVVVPSVTDICSPITSGKYQIGAGVIVNAAARGTRVHELCELYDYGAMPDECEAELVGYVKAWATFTRDYRPSWTHIEHEMYSVEDMFAGTADRIGFIDKEPVIVDIKTTSSLDRASKIALTAQLCGYNRLAEYNGIPSMQRGIGVQLHKDGKYTVHEIQGIMQRYGYNATELFNNLLKFYFLCKGEPNGKRVDNI